MFHRERYLQDISEILHESIEYEKFHQKSVLITGANGLIGSAFVDTLLLMKRECNIDVNVYGLCRSKEKAHQRFGKEYENQNFHLIYGDVTNTDFNQYSFDYIIHAASNAHPRAYSMEPVETMKANILGMINLLEYAKEHKKTELLYLSSSEVYGDPMADQDIFKEDDNGYVNSMSSRSCYPESKRAAETLCVSYQKEYGVITKVARLGYIYGSVINPDNSRADSQFIHAAVNKQDIIMKSQGEQIRSYCYLTDTIKGLLYIMLNGKPGEAYNIANPDSVATIREFAETLTKKAKVALVFDLPDHIEQQGYSKVKRALLSVDKIYDLGWRPKISLEDGILRILDILS